ncbi:hypothetical protein [Leptospira vanthielii]|uniref:Restriction endonuclease n=1 Tax=Leptospira vanthielii serovar Holland str. Waz Holland = ATCC 700522 TaxID=1218591 RepID=N1VVA1_9LEPT|nr:hypothetical protein [Leptospira vanthielii]EMY67884.1 hypothetical protein LEP1GSC199_0123 [Leptospira vanthielii serovar Holland str. Waz Holland = ATCC 700522]
MNIIPKEENSIESLFNKAKQLIKVFLENKKSITDIEGSKFESIVFDFLKEAAIGTTFEGKIDLISGQKFPDIVINNKIGLEVKTTRSKNWKTTGNSVFEGTRVDGIDDLYLICAKLTKPYDILIKPYEDCLTEIVVTHSPRYLIDMEIDPMDSIFNKMEISYDDLRKSENPIRPIIDYYKSKLKDGQSLWWIDEDNTEKRTLTESNLVMQVWNTLESNRRAYFCALGFLFFPELISNSKNEKYSRFSLWLVTSQNIICNNVRDIFTAGGIGNIAELGNKSMFSKNKFPRILINLFQNLETIKEEIENLTFEDFSHHWKDYRKTDSPKEYWISEIKRHIDSDNSYSVTMKQNIIKQIRRKLNIT